MNVQTQEASGQVRPPNSSLEFPDGTVYVITEPAERTGGERFEMEMILAPDGDTPPPHIHPRQREHYEVLEGAFDVQIAGTWHTLTAGQTTEVQPGERHHVRNSSGGVTRVRTTFRPALSFQVFIETVHQLITCGKLRGPGDPKSLLYLSMLFHEHRDTVRAAAAPQRIAMTIMNVLGRLLRLQLPPTSRELPARDIALAKRERERENVATQAKAPVAGPTLAAIALAALALSIAVVIGLRELGDAILDVPNHFAPLSTSTLIPATVLSVIGNTFGYFVSFSLKPSRYSMRLFLGIGAVMTVAGIAISMEKMPASAGSGSIITTLAASVAPVIVIVPALLILGSRSNGGRIASTVPSGPSETASHASAASPTR